VNYGSKAYLANALDFFNRKLSYFILGYFLGALDVGYFAVAIGLAEMIWIIPSTVSFVLFPSVASADSGSAGDLTAMSCRFVFFVSTTLCVAAAALGGIAIHILYGDPFAPSYLPLVLLLPGILLSSTGSLTSSFLAGIGKVIYAPIINATGLVLAITLNLLLIPSFGIVGASVATSICYAYAGLLGVHFFRKHSKMSLSDVYLIKRKDISVLFKSLH
jgi:O-antigen/teichoic acid export membrane protein